MTTNNRPNEPTEAMILAALNAYSSKGLELDGYETTEEYPSLEMWGDRFASQMRAALVAAQGAAPQDPERIMLHHPDGTPKSNDEIRSEAAAMREGATPQAGKKSCGPCRRGQHGCCDGNEYLRCECSHGAAPVLPSSGVDEEKLAEVIRKLRFNDAGCWADGIDCTESVSDHADEIARAVAEWLKGQGNAARE